LVLGQSILKTAFLGLGSNIGAREANLREAVKRLEWDEIRILRRSALYETAPQELLDQPCFLNAVTEIETSLFPMQLLQRVREIERQMGRRRAIPNGPRNIDIDLLFYGRSLIASVELEVPHPRIAQRRFVLEPLAEIAPDFRHPLTGRTASEMLAGLEPQGVRRLSVTL
jgi:2-amino-4-hydroxy-6-hydroxymethyldihydropteridine diphosphokinase